MGATSGFRQQHRELLELVGEIAALFDAGRLVHDSTQLRLKLSTWVRKFRVHLTLEDRLVYSRLLHHPDLAVRSKASEHQREMRTLREHFAQYTPARLVRDLSDDIASSQLAGETKRRFELITTKFAWEESELYELADEITSGTWALAQATAQEDEDPPSEVAIGHGGKRTRD